MFDYSVYYKEQNDQARDAYEQGLVALKDMIRETEGKEGIGDYYHQLGEFMLMVVKHEEELNKGDYFTKHTFEELKAFNRSLYEDILPENYESSYGNPTYVVASFGQELGQILAALYGMVRDMVPHAYEHKRFYFAHVMTLVTTCYGLMKNREQMDIDAIKGTIREQKMAYIDTFICDYMDYITNPEISYLVDVVLEDDLTDLRYLFKYGRYISENEIGVAEYANTLPEETVQLMADTMSEGLRKGYIRDNKDINKKKSVSIRHQIGYERVIRKVIKNFRVLGLQSVMNATKLSSSEFANIFTSMFSTLPNRQYYYDHRYDYAVYLNEAYGDKKLEALRTACESLAENLKEYGGPALLEPFGEKAFAPKSKKENVKLNDEQTAISKKVKTATSQIVYSHMPRDEWSFTIVSYPVPEIGQLFQEIFDATIKVNTLDENIYDRIQNKIIDALDEGEYVHIKGKGTNKTDIKVNLYPLKDPEKETRFHNCLADVNIPVGEVYTSPVLTGTNGMLFVEEVFLKSLKYMNLEITFKDGFIDSYTCGNFEDEEACKNYVHENLILPHDTLPLGEFAIGTNTTAYVMAQKFQIMDILPILITEKMGPHFAIGDTCFMWGEDVPVYNSNGKEVVARDNEKSILRKTDIDKAYTGLHTDITLPYSGLEFINIVKKDGEIIQLINDGRFVLPGTEDLNKAFDEN